MLHTVYSCAENTPWSSSSRVRLPGTSEGGSAVGFGSRSLLPAPRDRAGLGEAWRCPRDPARSLSLLFFPLSGMLFHFFSALPVPDETQRVNPEQEVFITRDPSPVPAAGLCPRPRGLRAPSTAPSPRCREQTHQTGFQ